MLPMLPRFHVSHMVSQDVPCQAQPGPAEPQHPLKHTVSRQPHARLRFSPAVRLASGRHWSMTVKGEIDFKLRHYQRSWSVVRRPILPPHCKASPHPRATGERHRRRLRSATRLSLWLGGRRDLVGYGGIWRPKAGRRGGRAGGDAGERSAGGAPVAGSEWLEDRAAHAGILRPQPALYTAPWSGVRNSG